MCFFDIGLEVLGFLTFLRVLEVLVRSGRLTGNKSTLICYIYIFFFFAKNAPECSELLQNPVTIILFRRVSLIFFSRRILRASTSDLDVALPDLLRVKI